MVATMKISMDELKSNHLFEKLTAKELGHILLLLEPVEIKNGKFLIREGSDGTDMYFIASGKVKVCRADKDGNEVILAICGPGEMIGEIALLTESKRTADVVSIAETRLFRCSQENFHKHCEKYSGLAYSLLVRMANRVKNASMRITDLALYDVTCRVARVLLEMSVVQTRDDNEVHMVTDKPTHQTLASMVGASREAVTRALGVLESEGHLEMDEERMWLYSLPGH